MEEQNKTPEKEVNKMETSNLSHAELKTMNLGEEQMNLVRSSTKRQEIYK